MGYRKAPSRPAEASAVSELVHPEKERIPGHSEASTADGRAALPPPRHHLEVSLSFRPHHSLGVPGTLHSQSIPPATARASGPSAPFSHCPFLPRLFSLSASSTVPESFLTPNEATTLLANQRLSSNLRGYLRSCNGKVHGVPVNPGT